MVNAWSLAASVLDGTLDEDYPIMAQTKQQTHSYYDKDGGLHLRQDDFKVEGVKDPSYYDYTRNDPDAKNPFTDAFDHLMAQSVVSGDDGYPSEFTTLSDNDDQIAHHIDLDKEIDRVERKLNTEGQKSESMAHYFKYHEEEILKDIEEYVSATYRGHYTGDTHEYRNVQTIDLMAARSLASSFCQSNILKYGSRYGSKDGKNKKDLMKVIHYAMLLLHFDEHYGKPSITSGNIDHNMP